ncbi:MAG: hypothetical protein ABW137_10780 [Mycobacterium sp.]
MAFALRRAAPPLVALGGAMAILLAPAAASDPDIDTESAAAVIQELQEQGYSVQVNGAPAGDVSLLSTCVVRSIHNPGDATTDPTTTTIVDVAVACPITHG